MSKPYLKIVTHYEKCLTQYGDTHLGVDWASADDAEKRYRVMLDLINEDKQVSLLDFGCGTSHLLDYILDKHIANITYTGLDISPEFVKISQKKYPETNYLTIDILDLGSTLPVFDYIVMNGVFTEKGELSFNQMFDYFREIIRKVYPSCRAGLAFNVRSKHVGTEERDLFHLPFDELADFLSQEVTHNYTIRHDYGLQEYTVYLYPTPRL